MKKLLLVWLALTATAFGVMAQNAVLEMTSNVGVANLQQVAQPYFKLDPYKNSFSQFLQEFINDPDLQYKVLNKRTDSTFFFASGTYKRFNPFIYRPTTLKVAVIESEFSDSDTSSYRDTVLYYQLLVTTDSTAQSEQFVKKEYNRLLRKHDDKFTFNTQPLNEANSAQKGEIAIGFFNLFAVSPITIAWGRELASRNYVFSLTLRMKVQENRATLVTLPQEPIRLAK
jgi:hypothetical protein